MKNILIITYYWPPSGGAGVQRWLKFVKYFPQYNLNPIVLTVDENYASYPMRDESLLKEVDGNIRVIRTKTQEPFSFYKKISGNKQLPSGGFSSGDSSSLKDALMRFIRGNFFIPDARKGWNSFALQAARNIIEKENISAIITSSPPHSTQLIGLKLKEEYNLPWIADLRDPWTDIYYYKKMLHTFFARQIDKGLEKKVLESADKIVVVSDSIKKSFLSKSNKIKEQNIAVLPNGYDETDFENSITNTDNSKFIITYVGTIAESYNPYVFFNAIAKLIQKVSNDSILFRMVGSVPKNMHDYLQNQSWSSKFEYVPYASHEVAVQYMRSASVLYLAIPNAEGNKGILTGKLFEYLASSRPIIATGPVDGDASLIISSCKAGKMFLYEDEKGLLEYLEFLLDAWKKNQLPVTDKNEYFKYSRKNLTAQFSDLIANIVS